jgi:16S rRNA (uracil1498-N3)-methyltransferase
VSKLQRYFISNEQFQESAVNITGEDARHIWRVMRMNSGDAVICCNKDGQCAVCKLAKIGEGEVTAEVDQWLTQTTELPLTVDIAQGLPKGDKFDLIVQKGTELGAGAFYPFKAARSIVKWDEKKERKKTVRLQKIAKESAEQSHRSRIPDIHFPMTLKELCERNDQYDVKIIAYEEDAKVGEQENFSKLLHQTSPGSSVLVVIGPEGGLTGDEVTLLRENGFVPCGLGPRILRTETAALYALASISYHFELMR